jgi:hypothetical protein
MCETGFSSAPRGRLAASGKYPPISPGIVTLAIGSPTWSATAWLNADSSHASPGKTQRTSIGGSPPLSPAIPAASAATDDESMPPDTCTATGPRARILARTASRSVSRSASSRSRALPISLLVTGEGQSDPATYIAPAVARSDPPGNSARTPSKSVSGRSTCRSTRKSAIASKLGTGDSPVAAKSAHGLDAHTSAPRLSR